MRCAMSEKPIVVVVVTSLVCALLPGAARAQTILTLRQAVSLALRSDARIGEAEIKELSAVREAELTGSRLGPNLFTGAGAVYTYGFPMTPAGAPPSLFNLGFTQTLVDLP